MLVQQQSKDIVRLWELDIGIFKEDYSSEWVSLSPTFAMSKEKVRVVNNFRKLNFFLKRKMSPISYSNYWVNDPFNGRFFLCLSIGLEYGLFSHQSRC
jgi:hypothetical protein